MVEVQESTGQVLVDTQGLQGPTGEPPLPESITIDYNVADLPETITGDTYTKDIVYNSDDLPTTITYTNDDATGYVQTITYNADDLPSSIDVTIF